MVVFLVRGGVLINSRCDERLRTPADSVKAPSSRALRVRTDFSHPITSERHRLWPLFRNSWPRMGPESICGGRGRCAVRCHYLATLVLDCHSKAQGHLGGDFPPRVAFFGSGFGQCQPTEPWKKRSRHFLVREPRGLQEIWGDHPDELGAPAIAKAEFAGIDSVVKRDGYRDEIQSSYKIPFREKTLGDPES